MLRRRFRDMRWTYRLLLDPDQTGSQQGTTGTTTTPPAQVAPPAAPPAIQAAPPAPAAQTTPPVQTTPPAAVTTAPPVQLTVDQYNALLAAQATANRYEEERRVAESRAEAERIAAASPAEQLRLANERAEQESQATAQRLQAAETTAQRNERLALGAAISVAVADQMTGRAFNSPVQAAQARRLLESELTATISPEGVPVVTSREGARPAAEYLAERLDSEHFTHFQAARNPRGGTGGNVNGGGRTPTGQIPDASQVLVNRAAEVRGSTSLGGGIGLSHHRYN